MNVEHRYYPTWVFDDGGMYTRYNKDRRSARFRLKDGMRRCQLQNGERFSGADDLVLIANVEQVFGRRILARENQQVRSDHSCQEN